MRPPWPQPVVVGVSYLFAEKQKEREHTENQHIRLVVRKVNFLLPLLRPVHPSRLSTMLDTLRPVGSPRLWLMAVLLKSGKEGPDLPLFRLFLLHQPDHTASLAVLRGKGDIELDALESVNGSKSGDLRLAESLRLVDLDLQRHFFDLGFGLQEVTDLVFAFEGAQVPGQG